MNSQKLPRGNALKNFSEIGHKFVCLARRHRADYLRLLKKLKASASKNGLEVLRARDAGKQIQIKYPTGPQAKEWRDIGDCDGITFYPAPSWWSAEYRVKPEPREFWLNRYSDDELDAHYSKDEAERAGRPASPELIHAREVLP